jgi:hypothetical protein
VGLTDQQLLQELEELVDRYSTMNITKQAVVHNTVCVQPITVRF